MISLNQESVNCLDAKLVTLLYRCNSMCCGVHQISGKDLNCAAKVITIQKEEHKKLKNYSAVWQPGLSTAFTRSFFFQFQCQSQHGNSPTDIWWAS
jgi:hypothetical protein